MAEPITNVLGIVGMENKGDYNSDAYYEKLNVVSYQGSSYCALDSVHNVLPTDTTKWQLIAEKGDTGDTGEEGYTPVRGTDYWTQEDIEAIENTLSSDVTEEVTNQLSDLTSATPLAASSTAGMTDTTRIYVNTTDGHWYWYDGEDWQDGGTYQAAEDSEQVNLNTENIENRKMYLTTDLDGCTLTGGGAYWFKNPLKEGYLKSVTVKSAGNNKAFKLIIYASNKTTKLFEKTYTMSSGLNTLNIDLYLSSNCYFGIETNSGTFYFGNNLLEPNSVANSYQNFVDNSFSYNYGFYIIFNYLNWILPNNGRILNTTNLFQVIDQFKTYNPDKLLIDIENKQIIASKNLLVANKFNTFTIPTQTITYTATDFLVDNHYRSVYYSIQTSSLYVDYYMHDINDILICIFNDDKILYGSENAEFKDVKTIIIGDSYAQGYSPDGNVTSWATRLKNRISFVEGDTLIKYKGGTGFDAEVDNINFLTLLQNAESDIVNLNHVERIIVCGGYNDSHDSHSLSNVYNKIIAFITYASSNFPNARIYIGMIGYSTNSTQRTKIKNKSLYCYQTGASIYRNAAYLTNSEFSLSDDLMASDGYHPNSDGQEFIARNIQQCLQTGCGFIQYNKSTY